MRVLIAASEAIPFVSTGGLGAVTGSLLRELLRLGADARLILPLYRGIKERFELRPAGRDIVVALGDRQCRFRVHSHEGSTLFLECDEFFDREELYGTPAGDYEDNALRFIAFSRAVLEACVALDFIPDVVHCNDWQTGLIPLYVKTVYRKSLMGTATLMAVHNLGYQGIFPASDMTLTGLDMRLFNPNVLEYYGQMNFLKAGIVGADAVSTVSMKYAEEIKTEHYGFGLDGVLRGREVTGILNGLDYDRWNPASDDSIAANYDAANPAGKKKCKEWLVKEMSFRDREAPLVGMVGRLSAQKGVDLMADAAERFIALGVNLAVLGRGDEALQNDIRDVAARHPGNVSLNLRYDEDLARMIFAGSDMILVPSMYEPCGLAQMIAMRYGAVPVARATGGIADTIEDYRHLDGRGTGFLFSGYNSSALEECLKRALCVYSDSAAWTGLVRACMKADFSWRASALKYHALYSSLSGKGEA